MWTVTFLRVSDGPVSLTSLRLNVSPARSRKNTRKITIVACDMNAARLIEPASTQSMTRIGELDEESLTFWRRCCVTRRASEPTLLAARSISAAAACICCSVDRSPVVFDRMRVTFEVRVGRSSMILKNSPCSRYTVPAIAPTITTVTSVAPTMRRICQRSSQRTTGLRV